MVRSFPQDIPRFRPRNLWDALADIEVFIYAAGAELEAMHTERTGVHRRGQGLANFSGKYIAN